MELGGFCQSSLQVTQMHLRRLGTSHEATPASPTPEVAFNARVPVYWSYIDKSISRSSQNLMQLAEAVGSVCIGCPHLKTVSFAPCHGYKTSPQAGQSADSERANSQKLPTSPGVWLYGGTSYSGSGGFPVQLHEQLVSQGVQRLWLVAGAGQDARM